ncbi:hypothetical protein L9F63_011579, partial [Diploptera punctata]
NLQIDIFFVSLVFTKISYRKKQVTGEGNFSVEGETFKCNEVFTVGSQITSLNFLTQCNRYKLIS